MTAGRGQPTVVRVADAGDALRAAAAAWRDRFDPLVVGVTGSLAKTSTKEQVAEVLADRAAPCCAARATRTTRSACR